ncbi:helix-turn-helix transcriptional regulator [Homoserinibacter sp. YIM 151385]|uniref:helix-turn-helix transcriptional regulator n=1 Tax=Homoserinibacter sp. YIM 151385 TaxID=2985506 RepID=UPI0022EFFB39|nr:helix-turn-helix transcriptional regulator [Homoserinibacter sp. YIM 151385]WBU39204.1 helix-turn-helix transcriptional regulator [Homoserinibacter sp. YIM 151385]
MVDRPQLADFLRTRREALQPEDVGIPRGPRRRADGLRREEVALLSGMSTDYYTRLEQQRGPQPSEQMLTAIARGMRLTLAERDHLFRLAGHTAPARTGGGDHIAPGLMRVLDRLQDTPAQILSPVGEILVQTPPAVALFGDASRWTGLGRATVHRWFHEPASRDVYPADDHELRGRIFVSELRAAAARDGERSRAAELVRSLAASSEEFRTIWAEHEVALPHGTEKRLQHPELGVMELQCQKLLDPDHGQLLLVFTATPGSESHEKLQLLSVIGHQQFERAQP